MSALKEWNGSAHVGDSREKKNKDERTREREREGGGETERGGLAFAPARAASAPRVSV